LFETILARIAKELTERSVRYMVIGGQAVLLYGEPRLTKDIDITLGLGIEGLPVIKEVVAKLSFTTLVEDTETFVRKTLVLPVMDEDSGIRIDFIFSFSHYEKQALERATVVTIRDTPVNFASLEDVVIHKIIAGRPRDIEDIRSILIKNTDYDRTYIDKWLAEFDKSLGEDYVEAFRELVSSLPD
jgi:predicted nucleotidyltransferase